MSADFVGVAVIVLRPMMLHNKRHEVGEVLHLVPADAAAAVGSGRAKLKDPTDRARCDAALDTENRRVMAACGRVPAEPMRWQFGGR